MTSESSHVRWIAFLIAAGVLVASITLVVSPARTGGGDLTTDVRANDSLPAAGTIDQPVTAPSDLAQGLSTSRSDVELEPIREPDSEELAVDDSDPAGEVLLVRVVDEHAVPVVGAVVLAHPTMRDVITDGNGLARLVGLRPEQLRVHVTPADRELRVDPFWATPGGDEARVIAWRVVHVSGRVVDTDGVPLAGVVLWISESASPEETRRTVHPTTAEGFLVAEARSGPRLTISISGKLEGRRNSDGSAIDAIALRGALREIVAPASDLVLVAREPERHLTVKLRTVDPEGRPVAGVRVTVSHYETLFVE